MVANWNVSAYFNKISLPTNLPEAWQEVRLLAFQYSGIKPESMKESKTSLLHRVKCNISPTETRKYSKGASSSSSTMTIERSHTHTHRNYKKQFLHRNYKKYTHTSAEKPLVILHRMFWVECYETELSTLMAFGQRLFCSLEPQSFIDL